MLIGVGSLIIDKNTGLVHKAGVQSESTWDFIKDKKSKASDLDWFSKIV